MKREIVSKVAQLTPSNDPVDVEHYRVGLGGLANSCIQILENMGAGIGILGLVGMGGIGKTTLAREIYNYFVVRKKFKCMTFLETHQDPSTSFVHVRPIWSRKLRKQILWDMLRVHDNTSNYSSWFQKISTLGPVFVVIDDVHKLGQFEELVPSTAVLAPGSRVVVTSRDRSVLNKIAGRTHEYYLFDVPPLGVNDSNDLFNWHTFRAKEAPPDYKELAKDVVQACGGLPLALKVTGSSLSDKRSDEDRETIWPEAIDALSQSMDVTSALRWSYDSLPELEKFMFVDIACQFYNRRAKDALEYWKSCRHCASCDGVKTPYTSLRNLIDKNFVILGTQEPYLGYLTVHGVLRDLGREIGHKTQSHLVDGITAEAIVTKNRGTDKTRGLNLARSRKRKFQAESFAAMTNLHFLVLPDGCSVSGDFGCISKELRWLEWKRMPFAHVPAELHLSCVTSLDFSYSANLASVWTESNVSLEACPNLVRLDLSACKSITKLPASIGQSSRLQYLGLYGCEKLQKLPKSIGQLKALETLQLGYCTSLKALPDTIGVLPNLQTLWMKECRSLLKLPSSIGDLSSLQSLELQMSTQCQPFSDGIGEGWTTLSSLTLSSCGGLETLLHYTAFKSLQSLSIGSNTITKLPESFGFLTGLMWLKLESCERLQSLPKSIGNLKRLINLNLTHCDSLKKLPKTLGLLTSLLGLHIECCPIKRLPKSIGLLSKLLTLEVKGCKNLKRLSKSIRQLEGLAYFHLDGCGNIEAMGALTTLQGLPIWGNTSITKLPPSIGIVSRIIAEQCIDGHYARTMRALHIGSCQVLEEDHTSCLEAYHDESAGVTSLLRVPRKG